MPDLVDLDQLSERLSSTSEKMAALIERGEFPSPHLVYDQQPLWLWPQVTLWLRRRWLRNGGNTARYRQARDVEAVTELVGLPDIAQRLKIPLGVVRYWARFGNLPEPDYRWSHSQAWIWPHIAAWAETQSSRRFVSPAWAKFAAHVKEARGLVDQGAPTRELRLLVEETAEEEAALLGSSRLAVDYGLTDAEFLARFDSIRDRLDEIAIQLENMKRDSTTATTS